jgi:DNA-binding response OmpR family regulator
MKRQRRGIVLLVDDHQASRDLLRRILALSGWEVLEAATVAEGLAQLDPPPDCIVLDLELPDGPGEAILRKVRMERLPIRVVVNTGMPKSGRLSEVSYMRPDAVLQKPLDAAGLLTICNCMNS